MPKCHYPPSGQHGFTLIELSIVLVIIGLLVGGILVGRDLIAGAAVRSQIAQIEQFQTAHNTFRSKYNALPGDISAGDAQRAGLGARGTYKGTGDGNGLLEGISAYPPVTSGQMDGAFAAAGETLMFWVDLSAMKMIPHTFSTATATSIAIDTNLKLYMPYARIGQDNIIVVYSFRGVNHFSLSRADYMFGGTYGVADIIDFAPALTVDEAYKIDSKIDDGKPGTGAVFSAYQQIAGTNNWIWSDGYGTAPTGATLSTAAKAGSATSCTDNANTASTAQSYSITQNGGRGRNCALSFKFQ